MNLFLKAVLLLVVPLSVLSCANKQASNSVGSREHSSHAGAVSVKNKTCVVTPAEISQADWVRRPGGFRILEEQRFFAEIAQQPGVVALPSGVHYKILRAGCGEMPTRNSTVKVRYHLTLLNGSVIDSSYYRKETPNLPLNQVIPGWAEAVTLMQPGAIWEIYIPSYMGYGAKGGGPVPGNAGLIFTVELLGFN
jgi:FKBP-type peptidyl-prolyl cis-trans isomerase